MVKQSADKVEQAVVNEHRRDVDKEDAKSKQKVERRRNKIQETDVHMHGKRKTKASIEALPPRRGQNHTTLSDHKRSETQNGQRRQSVVRKKIRHGMKTLPSKLWIEIARIMNNIESESRWPTSAEVVPIACLSKIDKQVKK